MADTFRVVIDVEKIRANLWTREQARLTEAEIRYWLQSVGFRPDESPGAPPPPGNAGSLPGDAGPLADAPLSWLADADALRRLDRSEVISVRPV